LTPSFVARHPGGHVRSRLLFDVETQLFGHVAFPSPPQKPAP
jgi:hypothetical protein